MIIYLFKRHFINDRKGSVLLTKKQLDALNHRIYSECNLTLDDYMSLIDPNWICIG